MVNGLTDFTPVFAAGCYVGETLCVDVRFHLGPDLGTSICCLLAEGLAIDHPGWPAVFPVCLGYGGHNRQATIWNGQAHVPLPLPHTG